MHDGTIITHLGADILDRLAGHGPGAPERFAHAVELELGERHPGPRWDVYILPALAQSETTTGWKRLVGAVVVDVLLDPLVYGWDEALVRSRAVADRVLQDAGLRS